MASGANSKFQATRRWLQGITDAVDAMGTIQTSLGTPPMPTVDVLAQRSERLRNLQSGSRFRTGTNTDDVRMEFSEAGSYALSAARVAAVRRADDAHRLLNQRSVELVDMVRQADAMRAFVEESIQSLAAYRALAHDAIEWAAKRNGLPSLPSTTASAPTDARLSTAAALVGNPPAGSRAEQYRQAAELLAQAYTNRVAPLDAEGKGDDVVGAKTLLEVLRRREDVLRQGLLAMDQTVVSPRTDAGVATAAVVSRIAAQLTSVYNALEKSADASPQRVVLQQQIDSLTTLQRSIVVSGGGDVLNYDATILSGDTRVRAISQSDGKALRAVQTAYRIEEKEFAGELKRKNEALKDCEQEQKATERELAKLKADDAKKDRLLRRVEDNRLRLVDAMGRLQRQFVQDRARRAAPGDTKSPQPPLGASAGVAAGAAAAAAAATAAQNPDADAAIADASSILNEANAIASEVKASLAADFVASASSSSTSPSSFDIKTALEEAEVKASQRQLRIEAARLEAERKLRSEKDLFTIERKALNSYIQKVEVDLKEAQVKVTEAKKFEKDAKESTKRSESLRAQLDLLIAAISEQKTAEEALRAALSAADIKFDPAADLEAKSVNLGAELKQSGLPDMTAPGMELKQRIVDIAGQLTSYVRGIVPGADPAAVVITRHYRELTKQYQRLESDTEKQVLALQKQLVKPLKGVAEFQGNVEVALTQLVLSVEQSLDDAISRAVFDAVGAKPPPRSGEPITPLDVQAGLFGERVAAFIAAERAAGRLLLRDDESIDDAQFTAEEVASVYRVVSNEAKEEKQKATLPRDVTDRVMQYLTVPSFNIGSAGSAVPADVKADAERKRTDYVRSVRDRLQREAEQAGALGTYLAAAISATRQVVSQKRSLYTPAVEYNRENQRFQLTLRTGQNRPVITWPTTTGETYDAVKELRTRAVDAERRAKRQDEDVKEKLLDAKTTLKDATAMRNDITKALINISKATQQINAQAIQYGETLPPLQITERDSFEHIDAVFTSWLRLVNTAMGRIAVEAKRQARARGVGGGRGGGGGGDGFPSDVFLEKPSRAPSNPDLPKSPFEMIITLCKAVAGECAVVGLDRVVNREALPLAERRERALEAEARASAVLQYLSDKADVKTAPAATATTGEAGADTDDSAAARIALDMESADTFDAALERMLTSQMFAAVTDGLARLRSVNVKGSVIYRDMSTVQILTSKTLLPELMRLFAGLFRRITRQRLAARSLTDTREAWANDDAAIDQAQMVLFSGMRLQLPVQFKFKGEPPKRTDDNVWLWEHFVAVPMNRTPAAVKPLTILPAALTLPSSPFSFFM